MRWTRGLVTALCVMWSATSFAKPKHPRVDPKTVTARYTYRVVKTLQPMAQSLKNRLEMASSGVVLSGTPITQTVLDICPTSGSMEATTQEFLVNGTPTTQIAYTFRGCTKAGNYALDGTLTEVITEHATAHAKQTQMTLSGTIEHTLWGSEHVRLQGGRYDFTSATIALTSTIEPDPQVTATCNGTVSADGDTYIYANDEFSLPGW